MGLLGIVKGFLLSVTLIGLGFAAASQTYAGSNSIIYPKPNHDRIIDVEYPVRLLKLAVEKSEANLTVLPTFKSLPKNRALHQLKSNKDVDVVWARTSPQKEKDFLAIKIPIFKGLSGWKVPLVNRHRSIDLSHVDTVNELRQYSVIQGSAWDSRQVFEANDIVVHHAYEQRSLFEMLSRNRGDLLFQSVIDTWAYRENHRNYNVKMDEHLAVRFPEAIYFFVNRDNDALAKAIQKGLELSLKDGSFDSLFDELIKPYLARCNLEKRNIIELENPGFSYKKSALNESYWLEL